MSGGVCTSLRIIEGIESISLRVFRMRLNGENVAFKSVLVRLSVVHLKSLKGASFKLISCERCYIDVFLTRLEGFFFFVLMIKYLLG